VPETAVETLLEYSVVLLDVNAQLTEYDVPEGVRGRLLSGIWASVEVPYSVPVTVVGLPVGRIAVQAIDPPANGTVLPAPYTFTFTTAG
jgi:hypothetical protein